MSNAFTSCAAEFAGRYHERGYWINLPLTNILERQSNNGALVITDACGSLNYRAQRRAG